MGDEELEMKRQVEAAVKLARKEHQEMKKLGCPACGSSNVVSAGRQRTAHKGNDIYDALEYYCKDCEKKYERRLKLPDDYFLVKIFRAERDNMASEGARAERV